MRSKGRAKAWSAVNVGTTSLLAIGYLGACSEPQRGGATGDVAPADAGHHRTSPSSTEAGVAGMPTTGGGPGGGATSAHAGEAGSAGATGAGDAGEAAAGHGETAVADGGPRAPVDREGAGDGSAPSEPSDAGKPRTPGEALPDASLPSKPDPDPLEAMTDASVEQIEALAGYYDVEFDAYSLPSGCALPEYYRPGRLHLAVRATDGRLETRLAGDFQRESYREVTSLSATELVTQPAESSAPSVLTAALDDDGLAGEGTFLTAVFCEDGSQEDVALPVRIGPDVTPPVLRAQLRREPPESLISFDHTAVIVSEPLVGYSEYQLGPTAAEAAAALVSLRDVQTGEVVPHRWERPDRWELVGFAFTERLAVEGRAIELVLTGAATDDAGNALRAEGSFVVEPSGVAVTAWDMLTEPPGLARGAEYVPPETADSPCESGGCVVLAGETWLKTGRPTNVAPNTDNPFFSAVLFGDPTKYAQIRYRYFVGGGSPETFDAQFVCSEQGYLQVSAGGAAAPLTTPWRDYSHATEWRTARVGFQGPAAEKSYVVSLPPHNLGEVTHPVALVIDNIEAVEP